MKGKPTARKRSASNSEFSLFDEEEQVIREAEEMIAKLGQVADGVRQLDAAYDQGYREQRRLLHIGDRLQSDLHRANQALAAQADRLIAAQCQLEHSLEQERQSRMLQSRFLAMVSHEFRNPLAVVSTTMQVLQTLSEDEHPEWESLYQRVLNAVQRMSTLIEDCLASERVSIESVGIQNVPFAVRDILLEAASPFQDSPRHPLFINLDGVDATVMGDPALFRVAVSNLLDNAVKYSPQGGPVALEARLDGSDSIAIDVTDIGIGVPDDMREAIFQKYIRGTVPERIPGAGLGLFLVDWIAKAHGGEVTVESAPGRGSRFRLRVPQHHPPVQPLAASSALDQ
ncbi:MAG TPA: HAMP domain-containing sensor histidine kinase [Rhodocyclaceae bacterium]|nr:HAMP domain-containing sensor histidine kinase [Rhodocyclaceae bacterium]